MDRKQQRVGGGVKVTYIETSFVTSDAAGFKDLVQRLTGKSPTAAAGAKPTTPHRPQAFHAGGARTTTTTAAGAGAEMSCHYYRQAAGEVGPAVVASRAPPCQEDLLVGADFFSDLFYVGAGGEQRVQYRCI
nr:unnamed protein product [Digitaria exilis]